MITLWIWTRHAECMTWISTWIGADPNHHVCASAGWAWTLAGVPVPW
jgi:hypothetical protein